MKLSETYIGQKFKYEDKIFSPNEIFWWIAERVNEKTFRIIDGSSKSQIGREYSVKHNGFLVVTSLTNNKPNRPIRWI